ncbi:GNAT family N-acetyltransferase [Peribacillus sp. JNUCC 23]
MEIKTERCTVRRFEEKDLDDFMQYRNDENWMRYQGFKGLTKQMYAKELLSELSFLKGGQLAIINNTTNRLIGDVYLKRENHTFWIGYTISPIHTKQGYAYEVLVIIIAWLKQKGCISINAGVSPGNLASINLLKKLKFTYLSKDDNGELIYTLDLQKI